MAVVIVIISFAMLQLLLLLSMLNGLVIVTVSNVLFAYFTIMRTLLLNAAFAS